MTVIAGVGFNTVSKEGLVASIKEDLRYYAEIGADFAEICLGSIDIVAGGKVIETRRKELTELAGGFPLKYTVHGIVSSNYMNAATVRRQIDTTKAMLEICDSIGAGILVQHSGFVRSDLPLELAEANKREFDALGEVGEAAAKYGIRIAVENIFTIHGGEYRKTPSQVAETIRELDHKNVVALTDFSHAYIECTYRGLDFMSELRAMAPVTGHLHVHDSFGQRAGHTPFYYPPEGTALGLGDLHLPLGWGDIPWETIFSELTFLPGTVLMMEIGPRFRTEQVALLEQARRYSGSVNARN